MIEIKVSGINQTINRLDAMRFEIAFLQREEAIQINNTRADIDTYHATRNDISYLVEFYTFTDTRPVKVICTLKEIKERNNES